MSGKSSPIIRKGKVERILALSLELTDLELDQLIRKLSIIQNERNQKVSSDNTDTISV